VNVSFGWTGAVAGWLFWRRAPAVAAAVLWIEALWIARSGRLSRRSHLLAASAGLAFAGLPLAMKLRMRRAHA
jgi:hypothetical protein